MEGCSLRDIRANMRRGHQGKTDQNHVEIVRALLSCGCSVQSLASVGLGCPDLLVGCGGVNYLIEIKGDPSVTHRPAGAAGLTDDQKKFHRFWNGQVATVETVEQALSAVGITHGAWEAAR